MVVRLVQPPDSDPKSEPLALDSAASGEATEQSGDGLSNWTLLSSVPNTFAEDSQLQSVLQDVTGQPDVTCGYFGDSQEFSAGDCDPYAGSLSAEPSIARSSEVGLGDRHLLESAVAEVVSEVQLVDTATALEVAARSIPTTPVEQIWEQGIWGVIFGDKELVDVYKPYGDSLKRPVDTSAQSSVDVALPPSSRFKSVANTGLSHHDVVKDKPDIPWQEQRDADLQSSVKLWMALVNRWDTGCSLVAATLELAETSRIFNMFAHLFAGRSPMTIKKRGYSLMRL